jgi:PAS domain S-box-containing protein
MGWWSANMRVVSLDTEMRERLLREAVVIADTLNPDLVRQLTFTAADKGSPAFDCIREQMLAVGKTFFHRGVWSESLREGRLFFGPESYAENDPVFSPPGTEYRLPPAANLQVFKDKHPVTIGPYQDEYGTFVSALVPVLEPDSGAVLMVVCIDIMANDWQAKLNAARITPLLSMLALILLLAGGAIAIRRRNRRDILDKLKFRKWIIAPVALAMLGGLLLYGTFEYWEMDAEFRQNVLRSMEQTRIAYNQTVAANVTLLRSQIDHIAGDPMLLKAWQERDRVALNALVQPVFKQLKQKYGITHYSLIAPDRVCFLRAHQPELCGDLIDRHTLLVAEKTGADAWGAELDPLGPFTLRYVRPWKQDGIVIGYLDMGVEIDNIGARLATEMNLDILTGIRKEYTTLENFEAGRRIFGFSGQWDDYPDFVMTHQTIPVLPEELSRWLEHPHSRTTEPDMTNIRFGEKRFACGVIRLFDAASRNVANLISLRDVTTELSETRNSLVFGLSLTTLLFGGILVLLWSIAGLAEQKLGATVKKLLESEVRLKQLAQHGRIIAWEVDEKGLYSYVSSAAKSVLGYRPDELVGRMHFYDLYPESGREPFKKDAFAIFVKREPFQNLINAAQTKDGRQIWLSSSGFPLLKTDGTLRGYRGSDTDITERNAAIAVLANSERKYRGLVESTQTGFLILDGQGRVVDANAEYVRMSGHHELGEILGRHVIEWTAAHSREKNKLAVASCISDGIIKGLEIDYRDADGRIISIEIDATVEGAGDALRVMSLCHDITERKRADAYREMGLEVLQILNAPGDLPDFAQRVINVLKNRTGIDAVGIRLQDCDDFPYFAQKGFFKDFLLMENTLVERGADGGLCRDKDGNASLECICGLVISGKTDPTFPNFTHRGSFWTNDSFPILDLRLDQVPWRHPRNQCIHHAYASMALVPIRGKDRIVGLIHLNDRRKGYFTIETVELLEGIASDIGATLVRKQTEATLRESEKRFMDVIYASHDAILLIDGERFVDCNEATVKMLGYSNKAQFLMTHPSELSPPVQPDGESSFQKANEIMGTAFEKGYHRFEWIHRKANGDDFPVEVSLTPVAIKGKNMLHCVWRDITEYKQAMEAQGKMERQIHQSQKLAAIGQLAGGIAHDFNNQLASIMGYADILYKSLEDETLKSKAERILDSSERSAELIKNLMAFSTKVNYLTAPVNINKLIEEVIFLIVHSIDRTIKIKSVLKSSSATITGDLSHLQNALLNLALNARDAMPDGGEIVFTTEDVDMEDVFTGEEERQEAVKGRWLKICVIDDGIGMDDNVKNHLFEPFFTTKPQGKGTGMGLASVYGTVKHHNGVINVKSAIAEGTEFSLFFPLFDVGNVKGVEDAAMTDSKNAEPGPATPSKKYKILLGDDDTTLRDMIFEIISSEGHEVVACDNGLEAVDIYRREWREIDLVLLDMMMPEMNGKNAFLEMKTINRNIRAILMSGYSIEGEAQFLIDAGAKGFIPKPFDIEILLKTVEDALK